MIKIGKEELLEESLIEICALPNLNTNLIIKDLYQQNYKSSLIIENTLNSTLLGLKAHYISDSKILFEEIDKVKQKWLFIDSIALYVDNIREFEDEDKVRDLYNKLWERIYDWKVTVIAINHFKMKKGSKYVKFIPRLGFGWYKMCSYRVLASYADNEGLIYKISRNSMIDL